MWKIQGILPYQVKGSPGSKLFFDKGILCFKKCMGFEDFFIIILYRIDCCSSPVGHVNLNIWNSRFFLFLVYKLKFFWQLYFTAWWSIASIRRDEGWGLKLKMAHFHQVSFQKGNDQEIEFQEIGIFQEIKTFFKIDQEVEKAPGALGG